MGFRALPQRSEHIRMGSMHKYFCTLMETYIHIAMEVCSEAYDDDDDDRDQAALVSSELIRVSILWHEMWHAALEDASRLYFELGDVDGMMAALDPLHAALQGGAETMREESFQQARDLRDCTCNLRDDHAEPLHCMSQLPRSWRACQAFGAELARALEHCARFKRSQSRLELHAVMTPPSRSDRDPITVVTAVVVARTGVGPVLRRVP